MLPFGSELLDLVLFLKSLSFLPLFILWINFNFVFYVNNVRDWLFDGVVYEVVKKRVLSHLVFVDDAGP
jgi:hypothetical protein